MNFVLIFIGILKTTKFGKFNPYTLGYGFGPNFYSNTIDYEFLPDFHPNYSNTIEYEFGQIFILILSTEFWPNIIVRL